jgi:hypothetical protein
LIKLSPPRIACSRRGSPVSSAIASVAIVSVGERIAPSTKPTSSGKPITQCATNATPTDVATTSPVASSAIGSM